MTQIIEQANPVVNRTPYVRYSKENRQNKGQAKLGLGAVCAKCGGELKDAGSYVVEAVQSPVMPVPAFFYYHWDHAPARGSGWGEAQPGERVLRPADANVGDVLLNHSPQFDSFNVVRVTKTEWADEPESMKGKKFYGIFVNPKNLAVMRQGGDTEMCFWDHDLTMTTELFRIKAIEALPAK